tara:strand:+ start:192 stop:359 length:168 start_codon:yes stop_codon:yes gene_type:complete
MKSLVAFVRTAEMNNNLPYELLMIRALAFFIMRILDKIYEGEDIWGANETWWDIE